MAGYHPGFRIHVRFGGIPAMRRQLLQSLTGVAGQADVRKPAKHIGLDTLRHIHLCRRVHDAYGCIAPCAHYSTLLRQASTIVARHDVGVAQDDGEHTREHPLHVRCTACARECREVDVQRDACREDRGGGGGLVQERGHERRRKRRVGLGRRDGRRGGDNVECGPRFLDGAAVAARERD